jgi:transposase
MRRIREILRLCLELKIGQSKVAESLGISSCTVNRLLHRAKAAQLSWPLPEELDDAALERMLYPPAKERPKVYPEPDWVYINTELKRKGVTLVLLWQEYKEQNPGGYQQSQFCDKYRQWCAQLKTSMRMQHKAGDKAFSDFAGAKFNVIDRATGEVKSAHLFVCTLGASNYTYANVYWSESSESWCTGQADAFKYFGGVTRAVVPDNPRAAVNKPCRYEPEMNEAYQRMAEHFGCAILPARVRHPKDKAKVESAVGVVTRWIFARLRKRDFFSLEELREAVALLLADLNDRPFKKLPGSRRTAFESLDKPALRSLPSATYEYSDIHKKIVGFDHHVEFEQHWYSVPYQLVSKEIELRVTTKMIEFLHGGKRVACHQRIRDKDGKSTTLDEHRPKAHREYAQRSSAGLLSWARGFGPATTRVVEMAFEMSTHAEQAYNRSIGILKLGKQHGADRLEAACQRGLVTGAVSYKSIKSILLSGLDRRPLPSSEIPKQLRILHSNIRGAAYFSTTEGETNNAN